MDSSRVYAEMAVANWLSVIHRQKRRDGTFRRRILTSTSRYATIIDRKEQRGKRGRNTPTMIRLDRDAQYIMLFTLLRKSEGRRRAKNRQGKNRRARGYSVVVVSVSLSRSLRLPFAICRQRGRKRKPRGQPGAYIYILHSIGFLLKVR